MEELISVIVPVYNVEKYIKKCIESIINQTYNNLEIILVDDGSTDKSGKICDEYAMVDKRISVIHKENGGLSDARNCGIDVAKGKYIAFVDSDDFIDLKMYEILYNNLVKNNADISICKPYLFEKYNEVVEAKEAEVVTVWEKKDFYTKMYDDYLMTVVAWNKLYKREIFENIRYPKGKKIEDAAIIHYVLEKCEKIALTNLELYFYYQRDDSIMHKYNFSLLDELDALYDRFLFFEKKQFVKENFFDKTLEIYCNKFFELTYVLTREIGYNNKVFKKYYSQLKYIIKYQKNIKAKIKLYLAFYLKRYYIYLKGLKRLLKKIYKKVFRKISNCLFQYKFLKYCKEIDKTQEKYIIFNGPNHGNIGDHAILLAEQKILLDKNIKSFPIMSHQIDYFLKKNSNKIASNDVILITGGGNFGTLWEHEQIAVNKVLEKFSKNKIIIFPQTVYYEKNRRAVYRFLEDKKIYKNCTNLLLCCRDRKSYEFCLNELEVNTKFTSDVVTYLNYSNYHKKRNGILICLRSDKEKVDTGNDKDNIIKVISNKYPNHKYQYVDTVFSGFFSYEKGKRFLRSFLNKTSKCKLFITDRLHGMIFATITGTPCIAFNNKSGKVKGVYEWIKENNKYVKFIDSAEEFEKTLDTLNIDLEYEYNNEKIKEKLLDIIN